MNIAITGYKGFIGSALKTELHSQIENHSIAGFDATEDVFCRFDEWVNSFNPPFEFDMIFHCGAISSSEETDLGILELNAEFTLRVARFAKHLNIPLVFLSSQLAEDPTSLYAWSKRLAEQYISALHGGVLHNVCILRLSNVWGDEKFEPIGDRNPSIVTKLSERTLPFLLWKCKRDFIHISDVVNALLGLVDEFRHGQYYLRSGKSVRLDDLAAKMGYKPGVDIMFVDPDNYSYIPLEIPPNAHWKTCDWVNIRKDVMENAPGVKGALFGANLMPGSITITASENNNENICG